MDDGWVMLRVRPRTAALLKQLMEELAPMEPLGKWPSWLNGANMTADRMVRHLVEQFRAERSRKRAYKRKPKPAPEPAIAADQPGEDPWSNEAIDLTLPTERRNLKDDHDAARNHWDNA